MLRRTDRRPTDTVIWRTILSSFCNYCMYETKEREGKGDRKRKQQEQCSHGSDEQECFPWPLPICLGETMSMSYKENRDRKNIENKDTLIIGAG